MELIQLKYFKTVASIVKISEAAEALFISPSALSTSISRLEKELGVKLFDRTNNRILLNQQGQTFLKYVNQVFAALEAAKTELRQNALLQGHHVSLTSVLSTQWVDLITAFTQSNPQFTLSYTGINRTTLTDRGLPAQFAFLLASDADIPGHYADKLDSTALFEDLPMLMVHPAHPLAGKETVTLQDLQNETLFLPMRDYSLYDNLVTLFDACQIPFPVGNSYSMLMAQQMVTNQLGVGFTSAHTVRTGTQPLRYLPIETPCGGWTCRLYWRKRHNFTQDELLFKDFVESYYRSDPCIKFK